MPSKRFLYESNRVTSRINILVSNLPYSDLFRGIINETEWFTFKLMRSRKIVIHGTTYCPKGILLLNCDVHELSQFGEIHEMFMSGDIKLFVITVLETEYFEWKLNAYCISRTEKYVKHVNI